MRPTEGTEVVPAWDYDFSGANEVHQSDDFEPLESVALFIPEGKPKTREKFKKKRDKARHKLDVSVSPEMASDYLASLNARDAVPPTVLVRDDIADNVQESTLSKPASRPIFEPAIKKTSKTLSIVEMAEELKKYVHIISYGNTLYYHNKYYYTQLDAKQLIKLYRKYVDYELNNESSLHGYKDLYDCFMTDPKIECNEPEDEPIYAPLKNGVFELVEWKLHPHSPDQVTFTYIKSKTADLNAVRDLLDKRQSLSDQIEQLEQEKTAIEQQVKLKMQDAAYGTAPGYKVSWVSSESKRVDSQRLKKEQPDIFNRYSKNVSSRRFTIIHAA